MCGKCPTVEQPRTAKLYDRPARIRQFEEDYTRVLTALVEKYPEEYSSTVSPETIAVRFTNIIDRAGITSININSRGFRALAKEYGISNTYKAWKDYFNNGRV